MESDLSQAFDDLYEALADNQSQLDAMNAIEDLPQDDMTTKQYIAVVTNEVAPYVNNLKEKLDDLLKQLGVEPKKPKSFIREASDATVDDFEDALYPVLCSEDFDIGRDAIIEMIKSSLGDSWSIYYAHDFNDIMISLNVKGKGQGDWNKFNKDGRADDAGIDQRYYSELLHDEIDLFHETWTDLAMKRFGAGIMIAGRMGGHWGFLMKELQKNCFETFDLDSDAVSKLWDSLKDKPSDSDIMPLAIMIADGIRDKGEEAKYIKFTPEFIEFCKDFEEAVQITSDEMASDRFNDSQFHAAL